MKWQIILDITIAVVLIYDCIKGYVSIGEVIIVMMLMRILHNLYDK